MHTSGLKRSLAITAAVLVLIPAAAHAAAPQPVSPGNGAVLPYGQDIVFQVQAAATTDYPLGNIATQPTLGPDGKLAPAFTIYGISFLAANPTGLYQGSVPGYVFSTAYPPGTYYWQTYKIDCVEDPVNCIAASPVWSFTVAPPTPAPTPPAPAPPARPDLFLTASQAKRYLRTFIRHSTHRRALNLHPHCSRRSSQKFRCRPDWRDSRNAYAGTATIWTYESGGRGYWNARFSGLKASLSCLSHKSAKRCAHRVRF